MIWEVICKGFHSTSSQHGKSNFNTIPDRCDYRPGAGAQEQEQVRVSGCCARVFAYLLCTGAWVEDVFDVLSSRELVFPNHGFYSLVDILCAQFIVLRGTV